MHSDPIVAVDDASHLPAGPAGLLFLLFHDAGAAPASLAPLAVRLAGEYPHAAVVCLRAPRPAGGAAEWFATHELRDDNRAARVAAALPGVVAAVRAQQRRFDLPWPSTALAGFAQGAELALEAVQAEPRLAGRVLAFGGRYATPPKQVPGATVHLFHGLDDTVQPCTPALASAERLLALGGDVTADMLPGIGHELHPRLIERAIWQLRNFLPRRVWREAMSEAPVIARAASSRELGPR